MIEARHQRIDGSVRRNLGGVDVELFPPDQLCLLAEVDDPVEEALEGVDAQALSNPRQAGMVGEVLIQRVAEIPAVGQMETRGFDELALGADPLKEHDELELEEDDGVDARPAAFRVQLSRPVAHEAQIQRPFQMAVEVVGRDELLQRHGRQGAEGARLDPHHSG